MHDSDFIYHSGQYKVHFSSWLPDDKGYVIDNDVYVPESAAYKFIFMNNRVDEITVNMAINHAINKLNRFIDNYKA